ncbi:MAG: YciI family protein [Anaerolineae bacterium]|nr:YciI family protein [Anaerolineae bacterium]
MKKFVFLYCGFEPPTPEIQEAWGKWFASIGSKMIDSGNALGSGKEITHDGIKDLPLDKNATTGYSIINAESLDEAVKIAQDCPIITSIRVYEAMSM